MLIAPVDMPVPPPTGSGFPVGIRPGVVVPAKEIVTALEWLTKGRLVRGGPMVVPLLATNTYLTGYMERRRKGRAPWFAKGGLVRSLDAHQVARHEAAQLLDLVTRWPHPDIRSGEPEHLDKACLQTGTIPGWQFPEGGLHPERAPAATPEAFVVPAASAISRALAGAGGRGLLSRFSYPLGRQKGAPFFTDDDRALEPCALMARRSTTPEAAIAVGVHVAERLGDRVTPTVGPCAIMFTRHGPTKKSQAYFSGIATDEMPRLTHMTAGYFDRTRHVNAVAAYLNMTIRPTATWLKKAIRATRWMGVHSRAQMGRRVARWREMGLRVRSADYSGYDKTISPQLYDCALSLYKALGVSEAQLLLYRWISVELGTIAPGFTNREPLMVINREGGLASGTSGTSVDGSCINFLAILYCISAATGWSPERTVAALEAEEWDVAIWGDDTLLALPAAVDMDAYEAAAARLGLVVKISEAPVFLMTLYGRGLAPTNLVSRTFAQSVWREHEQLRETLSLFGLSVRATLAETHPLWIPCWRAIATVAEPSGLFGRWKIKQYADLRRLVASTPFRKQLAADLVADKQGALRLVEGLTRGSGDLEDNPDAAFIIAALGGLPLALEEWEPRQSATWLKSRITIEDIDRSIDEYMRLAYVAEEEGRMTRLARTHRDRADEEETTEAEEEIV